MNLTMFKGDLYKIKIGVDKPQPLCYNKDTEKEINQKERKYEHDEYSKI